MYRTQALGSRQSHCGKAVGGVDTVGARAAAVASELTVVATDGSETRSAAPMGRATCSWVTTGFDGTVVSDETGVQGGGNGSVAVVAAGTESVSQFAGGAVLVEAEAASIGLGTASPLRGGAAVADAA
eukprot:jgi/Phyca11/12990/fgenesh1_pg.PHYCAscaffold_2_\